MACGCKSGKSKCACGDRCKCSKNKNGEGSASLLDLPVGTEIKVYTTGRRPEPGEIVEGIYNR